MYDYRDKLRGHNGRRSVYDILSLTTFDNWETIKTDYDASEIAYVKIDGNTFANYGAYQFIWEKTFVKSPERSSTGSLGNLNSYATFLTPHLILDFSIMSIDDYRAIMKMHYERNEFTVECYDPIYNKTIAVKMYFATEEMAKLYTINKMRLNSQDEWEEWIELVGVHEYNVELIGTNNDLDLVSVVYHLNPPSNTGYADLTIGEDDIYMGEDIIIGGAASSITSETFGGTYKFKNWNLSENTEENKGVYINGNIYTINTDIVLYAQWEETTSHILSYNYGIADPATNDLAYEYVTNKTVSYGKSIGDLPIAQTPTVKYKYIDGVEREYSPYYGGNWYNTPIKAPNSFIVTNGALYWAHRDSTIYLLYDVHKYSLWLYLDGDLYQTNSIEYNTPTNLPALVRSGYKFDGWYTTSDFENGTKFSGNMPPYDIFLYARWVKE